MLYFANDYTEGACKEILDAFIRTNDEKLPGYGTDKYTLSAKEKIKKACKKMPCWNPMKELLQLKQAI